jgi:phosphoglycolate phosphatase-like HAD superfamily hydrolase
MRYLFDIDGTLIGGDGSGRRAFDRACLDCMGIIGALDHLRLDGMTDPLILDSVFQQHHGRRPTDEETRAIFAAYVAHLEREVQEGKYHVKPAVHDTLDRLERDGATIGLATGNLEVGARIKLQRGDLWHRFGFGGYGSDAAERAHLVKIAIERGATLARRTFAPGEVTVIGDTPRDIAAAHACGARAVAVATGWYTLEQLVAAGADAAYPTMAEWLAAI